MANYENAGHVATTITFPTLRPSPPLTRPSGRRMWRAHRRPAAIALKAFACGNETIPTSPKNSPSSVSRTAMLSGPSLDYGLWCTTRDLALPASLMFSLAVTTSWAVAKHGKFCTVSRLPKACTEESSASSSFRLSTSGTLTGGLIIARSYTSSLLSPKTSPLLRNLISWEPPTAPLGL